MTSTTGVPAVHPRGERPAVELAAEGSVTAETFAGRVHLEWEHAAPVTTMGQLAFFIEYLKQGGLFESWVAGCLLHLTSPNAPAKRDVLGTVLLSVLAGHWRYAHITALRGDGVNAPLLGMKKVVSEDAVRRALSKIEEEPGIAWLREQLEYCTRPLLSEPWILDVDTTVKPLYGHQEAAVVGYNPSKRGRGRCSTGWARRVGRGCCAAMPTGAARRSCARQKAAISPTSSSCACALASSGCWSGRCARPIGRMPAPDGRASGARFGCRDGAGSVASCCCAAVWVPCCWRSGLAATSGPPRPRCSSALSSSTPIARPGNMRCW